jgi:O-antigen/teichoic acid export membrane protein
MKNLLNLKIFNSRLGKDALLTFIAQIVIMISAFTINKLLSIGLGVDNYGYYSIIKKTSSVIAFVILSGMGIALPRYLSYHKAQNDNSKMLTTVISALFIVSGVMCFSVIFLLFFKSTLINIIVGTDDYTLYILAIAFSLSIAISSFLYSFYRGNGNFVKFSLSQFAIQIVLMSICIVSSKKLSLLLFLWSLFTFLISSVLMAFEIKKMYVVNNHNNYQIRGQIGKSMKELSIYGVPRLIGDFLLFSFTATPLIVINMKIGIVQSSFFSVGITLMSMISPLFAFLGTTLLPHVSELFAKNEGKKLNRIIMKLLLIYCILAFFASMVIYFKIDFFIKTLFSFDFLTSASVCQIIIWTLLPQSVYLLLRNPLDAVSKIPFNTFNLAVSFILLLVLFFFSHSLQEFGFSFFISFSLLALLSFLSWKYCVKKYKLS